MIRSAICKLALGLFVSCGALSNVGHTQTFTKLADFHGGDGEDPFLMSLVQGRDGAFYGTTFLGGTNGQGTVFRVGADGEVIVLHSFCGDLSCSDGGQPAGGLIQASDGSLYGETFNGGGPDGYGTVFSISPAGQLATLHHFRRDGDGSSPYGPLVQSADGGFYGTTSSGGDLACNASFGCGTVFKITTDGTLTTLHRFQYLDGYYPNASLAFGNDGNLYGTTAGGGAGFVACTGGCGTVFKIKPKGTFSTLHSFHLTDGAGPSAQLVVTEDGSLYGTTSRGGDLGCGYPGGCGVVFKIGPGGAFSTLHRFHGADGRFPIGLSEASDGNLYGVTLQGGDPNCSAPLGCGTVFQITPQYSLTTLHVFEGPDGWFPEGALLQATNGALYATASEGGDFDCDPNNGCGTIFRLDMGLGPFVGFVRGYGRVGQTGGILGQGFAGTTSVTLNGVPADFKVISDTYLVATVPPGATSGYVTVTTPSGTLTSNKEFIVLQ